MAFIKFDRVFIKYVQFIILYLSLLEKLSGEKFVDRIKIYTNDSLFTEFNMNRIEEMNEKSLKNSKIILMKKVEVITDKIEQQ